MCHSTNFQDAYNEETDTYDFSYVFEEVQKYIADADIAVGNLETTFAGKEAVYKGYMKKMIVADRIMIPVDAVFDNPSDYKGMILFAN